ncbi:MAG: HAMP domain-containing histidine kinase [Thermoguttaceae bacterium]|nr:HAMP domain-containing histidine kinase [Thermoguttaceae bacterium]MDW8077787.1 HAMP domain-containing sensor histidine kinase [Thermoguttaceae bacterium]
MGLPAFLLLGALLLWAGVVVWQWSEYRREIEIWAKHLEGQGQAILSAVVGGVRGHRRMGQFFVDQLEAMLEEIAALPDVRAVGIFSLESDYQLVLGEKAELEPLRTALAARGEDQVLWTNKGVCLVRVFELSPERFPPGGYGPRRGEGRGPRWREWTPERGAQNAAPGQQAPDSPLALGGRFAATLLLSRESFDSLGRNAFVLRAVVVGLASLLLLVSTVAGAAVLQRQRLAAAKDLLAAELRHHESLAAAASGLAHETRNPLGTIRMHAQSLSEAEQPAVVATARAIVEECDRLATRINQFLAFARPVEREEQWVECEEVLRDLEAVLRPDLELHQVSLVWDVAPTLRRIRADREILRQVLFNLVSNAIAFSPPMETVEVKILPIGGNNWRIEVMDRGPGVPEEHRSKLFTPYFSTRPGGSGLGLAIVARLCRACGWQVTYRPRAGGGAIFEIAGRHES